MDPRLVAVHMGLLSAVLHMGPQLAVHRRDPGTGRPRQLNFLATDLRNRSRHSRSSQCTLLQIIIKRSNGKYFSIVWLN